MNDDLHTYIEPELEARITALVLGEASDFEVDELERLIKEQPELAIFHRRVEVMHQLLGDAMLPQKDEQWQLSKDRRAGLKRTFNKTSQTDANRAKVKASSKGQSSKPIRASVVIAACVMLCLVLFMMATPVGMKSEKASYASEIVTYQASSESEEEVGPVMTRQYLGDENKDNESTHYSYRSSMRGQAKPKASVSKSEKKLADNQQGIPHVDDTPAAGRLFKSKSGNRVVRRETGLSVERKPSIPASNLPEAIVSNATKNVAIPAPSVDFSNGEDFGDGWGGFGPGGRKAGGSGGALTEEDESDPFAAPEKEATITQNEKLRYARQKNSGGSTSLDLGVVDSKNEGFKSNQPNDDPFGGVVDKEEEGEKGKRRLAPLVDGSIRIDGIATGGLRSGDYAITRDSVDAILNNPGRLAESGKKVPGIVAITGVWDSNGSSASTWKASEGAQKDELGREAHDIAPSDDAKRNTPAAWSGGVSLNFDDDLDRDGEAREFRYHAEYEPPELPNTVNGDLSGEGLLQPMRETQLERSESTLAKDLANIEAKKQLEDSNDPIRTNPALAAEHMKKVDEVRKNLYMGEGYYNLGQYDEAEAQYKKVLQTDPYNKAARRWLEKVAATKSDYYRAAYDHTRAELLKEVDKAWEMAVPPVQNGRPVAKPVPPVTIIPSPIKPKALPDETITAATPFSTFSLNVSDVSFKLAKVALLEKGKWPDAAKVRTEEFVNSFDYGDPSPRRGDSVACAIEQSAHPFLQQRNLLRVGMKTAAIGRSAPLRLTILLDNSGSMEREDREESVLAAIRVLAAQLGPQDVITMVGFARQPRLLADRISGDKAGQLVDIVANTPSEGGTNIEEALRLARTLAKRQHTEGATDRVVLITDGVANLGNTIPEELSKQIVAMRQEGIAFDACGVGAEGLNDDILEALTRKGDGRYYFLNRAEDADGGFAKQLAGALTPAAKNVKVQVKFNAKRVTRYRLLGFEKHRLKKEDFRNDKVDAAEMAAEEAGNAVYQVQVNPQGEGELGQVFVRFLDVSTGRMVERSWPLPYEPQAPSFDQATPSMQLAGTAAMLGEKLHGTDAGSVRFSAISNVLNRLRGHFAADSKVQDLIRMCRKVK